MKRKNRSTAKDYVLLSPEDEDLREFCCWTGICGHIAVRFPGSKIQLRLGPLLIQRMGLEIPEGHLVDHSNRVPFDNQRENLRVITKAQNAQNNDALGVQYNKSNKNWRVRITREHKIIELGSFPTKELALAARKKFLDNEGLVQ